jgi:uncharacterized membrane protein
MNELYFKLKQNMGLTLILLIGLGVEFSNFQSMFFHFMTQYRPDWGTFNHIPAVLLSAFLLLCIVIFGIRKQVFTSWFLALITCVVSFSVYGRMNLTWTWEAVREVHFVVIILSVLLPMLVAYTTHQISNDREAEMEAREQVMRQRLEALHSQAPQRYFSRNFSMKAEKNKKNVVEKAKKQQGGAKKKPIEPFVIDEYEDENDRDLTAQLLKDWELDKKNLFEKMCTNCYNEYKTTNQYSKYCSDDCRMEAMRRRQKSDFYATKDNFDDDGVIEWTNPKT